MGTKLLLADDSITIQKVVGIIFANDDYDITVVDNGVSALEKAREQQPDLMLVDALMPGKSGYEVCQEVRGDATLKNVPLLLMIGAFEPFDEEKAHQSGADAVISKPFESQQLVEKVRELLDLGSRRSSAQPAPLMQEADVAEPFAMYEEKPYTGFDNALPSGPAFIDEPMLEAESLSPGDIRLTGPEPSVVALDVVEASPGDDPWGVFDLTDMDEEPSGLMEEPTVVEDPSGQFVATVEEVPVSEAEESGPVFLDVSELPEKATSEVIHEPAGRWGQVEEEGFTFQEEEPTPAGETFAVGMGEPLSALSQEPEVFIEPPESLAEPFATSMQPAEEVQHQVTAAPAEPAPSAVPIAFGEEQLRAILSQLSREVIEKVVWEVVPDLAENLIREEIRRLKAGMRDQ